MGEGAWTAGSYNSCPPQGITWKPGVGSPEAEVEVRGPSTRQVRGTPADLLVRGADTAAAQPESPAGVSMGRRVAERKPLLAPGAGAEEACLEARGLSYARAVQGRAGRAQVCGLPLLGTQLLESRQPPSLSMQTQWLEEGGAAG